MTTIISNIDEITNDIFGSVFIRRTDITYDDANNVVNTAYVRWSLYPGQDLSAQWPVVQEYCRNLWTPEVITNYQATRPVMPPPVTISRRDFLNKFTPQERITIRTAAKNGDSVAEDFIHILDISDTVTLTDQQTIDGINYCVSMGYISQTNANTILTP